MTRSEIAAYVIHRALKRIPGRVEIERLPCGIDVTVTLPPWRSAAHWQPIVERLVTLACPQIDTRVRVVSSWSEALGNALFAGAGLGAIAFAVWWVVL